MKSYQFPDHTSAGNGKRKCTIHNIIMKYLILCSSFLFNLMYQFFIITQ